MQIYPFLQQEAYLKSHKNHIISLSSSSSSLLSLHNIKSFNHFMICGAMAHSHSSNDGLSFVIVLKMF